MFLFFYPGTPEMLSPMSFDGAPTPPPQPSPGAFNKSPTNTLGYGQRYATSPRDQSYSSPRLDTRAQPSRYEPASPSSRYEGSQLPQRQYDSRLMNGNGYGTYSAPKTRYDDFSRSRQSPQQIRKELPPSLNITAKSVSTPNVNSHDMVNRSKQEEDLALARYSI